MMLKGQTAVGRVGFLSRGKDYGCYERMVGGFTVIVR